MGLDLFRSKKQASALWDELFITQVEVSFDFELPVFYRSEAWHSAQRVVDLGTGNGYFLAQLSGIFSHKTFLGLDISQEFIDLALKLNRAENLQFVCRDLFDETSKYDFVILRALVQNLDDFLRLLQKLASLTVPGGAVLLIELSEKNSVYFWPSAPKMQRFYTSIGQYRRDRRPEGCRYLSDLVTLACKSKEWSLAADELVVVPSTIDSNLALLRKQFALALELLNMSRDTYPISLDYNDIRKEWNYWCNLPRSHSRTFVRC